MSGRKITTSETSGKTPGGATLIGLAAAAVLAVAASGQTQAPQPESAARPPTAKVADKPPLLGNIIAAVVIFGAVVTASLLPSKRGHQD